MSIRTFDTNAPDAVFAFLDATVGRRGREHWSWKFRLGQTESASAFYWQGEDGRVLGFIGLMRNCLHGGEQSHPAAWFVDWHVPGEGGTGVGLGLLRKAEAAVGTLLTLQGSADTKRMLPRLGWKEDPTPVTWIRPLSSRFLSDRAALRLPAPLRALAPLGGAAASGYFRCRRPSLREHLILDDVERFPREYDRVWSVRRAEFAPLLARDSAYLNYLCADYPDGGYRLQLVRWRGETVGHLIWRLDPDHRGLRRGRIVDLLWPRDEPQLARWLIQHGCWQLQRDGADYVECMASVADLKETLRRLRFLSRGTVPLWYHRVPEDVPPPPGWYVSLLDCDRAYR